MRVSLEPSYVLHRHDWSETSLILDVFSRQHGRVALVARGAKRPSSNFRPVLLPLQLLRLSWSGQGELRTLKGAEWGGGHIMPSGDALMMGYYANELLLRLLAREDAHPRLFDTYAALVHLLASPSSDGLQAAGLRVFELLLLRETGHLPALHTQGHGQQPLQTDAAYTLVPETGLCPPPAAELGADALPGTAWLGLAEATGPAGQAPFAACLEQLSGWPAPWRARLRRQLRTVLDYHCGSPGLHTRALQQQLQGLQA